MSKLASGTSSPVPESAGYRTEEVAEMFNLSQGRISQLRREFEESWLEFQRDPDECDLAAA
jgi:hypothetical protein